MTATDLTTGDRIRINAPVSRLHGRTATVVRVADGASLRYGNEPMLLVTPDRDRDDVPESDVYVTLEQAIPAVCSTCGRPADDGYLNVAAHEACIDPIHDRRGMRVKPGAGIGREWLVEELHPSGTFYYSHGSFATHANAEAEVCRRIVRQHRAEAGDPLPADAR